MQSMPGVESIIGEQPSIAGGPRITADVTSKGNSLSIILEKLPFASATLNLSRYQDI